MNCHFLVNSATGCLVWGSFTCTSGKSLRLLSVGKHSNFSFALQKSRGGWKNFGQIFKLTHSEMFVPEYLFLWIYLKEYIRSSRTCCFILPTPEEGNNTLLPHLWFCLGFGKNMILKQFCFKVRSRSKNSRLIC